MDAGSLAEQPVIVGRASRTVTGITGGVWLYTLAIFVSAFLVFEVEPMVARMLLPQLGGAPAVWNTAMAFFQFALLAGYGYAHALQKLRAVRTQMLVHLAVLGAAALVLPMHISTLIGPPPAAGSPIGWTLAELALSVGAPFATLSATAPLLQAWFSRTRAAEHGHGTYRLYAASNFGSLLALISYPVLIEPFLHVSTQRLVWSIGYAGFAALVVIILITAGRTVGRAQAAKGPVHATTAARPAWGELLIWILLAAAPSSLMLGVTTQLTTDVGSAPLLWLLPLALYLVTFILAFGESKAISPGFALTLQAVAVAACVFSTPFGGVAIALQLTVHLLCFFLTALVCHAALAARRPAPEHLTLFYLCLSVGGVIGGSFNALLAPVVFRTVAEYPLVLTLSCLARPWGGATLAQPWLAPWRTVMLAACAMGAALGMVLLPGLMPLALRGGPMAHVLATLASGGMAALLFALAVVCAFLVRNRAVWFTASLGVIALCATQVGDKAHVLAIDRSFFGVIKVSAAVDPVIGPIHRMMNGTTLHGAQALTPGMECRPLTYYAPTTGIGETVTALQSARPSLVWATVGLGTGALAAYVRPADRLTYYEIDPLVVRYATDPRYFTYTRRCAASPVRFELGDARLTLAKLPAASQDLMIIDAFSSDAVPAHLLTVEAVRMYLDKLKPDGVLLFHLSNRHLELRDPVLAALRAAGATGLSQIRLQKGQFTVAATSTSVVVASRSRAALDPIVRAGGFVSRNPGHVAAWTDDYTNLIGAMLAHK